MERALKQVIFTVTFGFLLTSSSIANDDVIVNLSVLDSLNNTQAIIQPSPQKPLFPIVKKQTKIVKKTIKKKSAPQKVQVKSLPKPKNKVNIEVKQHQPIPFVESNEEIIVVDVEPAAKIQHSEKLSPQVKVEASSDNTVEPKTEQQLPSNIPVNAKDAAETKDDSQAPTLLLDEKSVTQNNSTSSLLIFETDVDTLNTSQQKQIDEIINQFENPQQNKIAIYAYNLDDGVDTFKKKRISLNRAVAVRSYLLPKGYKNFSIKVINIDESSNKTNMVELEELKN